MGFARDTSLHSANPDDLAIRRHHFAQYVLASKGSYNGPSLSSFCRLKELKATPNTAPVETLAIVEDKITELRRQHQEDIQLLTAFQAAEYHQEVLSKVDYLAAINRDMQFSRSIEEYHNIMERDIQLQIARFLQRSTSEQEKMMSDYGWVWRMVTSLISAFKTNEGFKNEISDDLRVAAVGISPWASKVKPIPVPVHPRVPTGTGLMTGSGGYAGT
ncbi:hypothetical protein BDR04DRAFT_1209330 [Suillus decipiens]|nr:hypothetical protein BDR04DRAFT_1209330 [Suillus decipiens]